MPTDPHTPDPRTSPPTEPTNPDGAEPPSVPPSSSGPGPGPGPGSAVAVAVAGHATRRRPPWWLAGRVRRERADAIATYHREVAARAARARAALAADGIHVGRAPYGYRVQERRLVPDPDTAHVVWLIYALRTAERRGLAEIAAILARDPDAFPPPGTTGQARHAARPARSASSAGGARGTAAGWTAGRVATVLAQPRYTGRQVRRPARRTPNPTGGVIHVAPLLTSDRTHRELVDDESFCAAQWLTSRPAPDGLLHHATPLPAPYPFGAQAGAIGSGPVQPIEVPRPRGAQ